MTTAISTSRNEAGQFLPGVSGNPAGRPVSRKNQITVLKQDLEVALRQNVKPSEIHAIIQSMVGLAKNGHVGAAKLILDKVLTNATAVEDEERSAGRLQIVIQNVTSGAVEKDVTPEEDS